MVTRQIQKHVFLLENYQIPSVSYFLFPSWPRSSWLNARLLHLKNFLTRDLPDAYSFHPIASLSDAALVRADEGFRPIKCVYTIFQIEINMNFWIALRKSCLTLSWITWFYLVGDADVTDRNFGFQFSQLLLWTRELLFGLRQVSLKLVILFDQLIDFLL